MELYIREATEEDLPTLLSFEQGVIEAERPFDDSLQIGRIHYYDLPDLMRSNEAQILVATIANEIVGSGYAKITPAKSYQAFTQYAYLGFMYVLPAHRGQGINQRILNELISWAKAKDVSEVRLEVYDQNTAAKRAYQKAGFTPNLVEMRLMV